MRSFLRIVTYCSKFIHNFSDITQPLQDLTKADTPFQWAEQQQHVFDQIKELLTSDTVMSYFDPSKSTELTTDGSPWGLSAILSQKSPGQDNRKVVA